MKLYNYTFKNINGEECGRDFLIVMKDGLCIQWAEGKNTAIVDRPPMLKIGMADPRWGWKEVK